MKGQPLAYNKDNQEDKEPLFDAVDTVTDTLRIFAEMIAGISTRPDKHARRLAPGIRHGHRPGRLPGRAGDCPSATRTKRLAWPCATPKNSASTCRTLARRSPAVLATDRRGRLQGADG
jgi:hypothetical protein